MTSQQQSVEYLFGAALEQKPEDRRAFLDAACVNAPEVRRLVEELLLEDARAGSFLEKPVLGSASNHSDATQTSVDGDSPLPAYLPISSPVGRFSTGQMIADRFKVVRFIARGGMGEVYEVEDTLLQNLHVALKIILPQIAGDAGSSRRFEQEVLLARKVVHTNLCPIYDISRCQSSTPPFLFMTMKLLAGETLAVRLKETALIPRSEAVAIFRQLVAGLAAIHAAGIIHRDIKPNNVMLDYSGSELCLTIMDFGLARLHDSETTVITRGMVAGTPGYIAPELMRGQCPSQATDIFALGVLLHQVLTGRHPIPKANSMTTEASSTLGSADVPPIFILSVREFLSDDPEKRCVAFGRFRAAFDPSGSVAVREQMRSPAAALLTRRNLLVGSAVAAVGGLGAAAWKWDWVDDLLHPIPQKRFVALLNWPSSVNALITPMLNGVIDAIANQLARAEAFDHNLYVTSHDVSSEIRSPAELNEVRDSLGANLVLAASGTTEADRYHVKLRLLDPTSTRTLREKEISSTLAEQTLLPERAIRAAEEMLDVSDSRRGKTAANPGTKSAEAFAAFQEAEAFRKQENGTGLDAAIEKYKQAIELDPQYAQAHARLAMSYCRWYSLHHDSAALDLARGNAETAIGLAPELVEGHLAMEEVADATGDEAGALREISKALALDPSNPRTLINQADLYTRLNRWDDADKTYKKILKQRPNNWLAYQEMGINYSAQGKYPEALGAFRAASLAAPKNALALSNVGTMYLLMGQTQEAEEHLRRSLALSPTGPTYAALAVALRSEGKSAEAVQAAQKAVELNPSATEEWIELGDCYSLIRGHADDAKSAYTRAAHEQEAQLQADAKDGWGWLQLALAQVKSGLSGNAKALIKKADGLDSKDVDSQITKVRILELLGDRENALAAAAACRKMGATEFQLQTTPDLEALRSDPRYKAIAGESTGTNRQ
jgi:serine/threonine protein kinase/Tfp pilus assembly protein PilF